MAGGLIGWKDLVKHTEKWSRAQSVEKVGNCRQENALEGNTVEDIATGERPITLSAQKKFVQVVIW